MMGQGMSPLCYLPASSISYLSLHGRRKNGRRGVTGQWGWRQAAGCGGRPGRQAGGRQWQAGGGQAGGLPGFSGTPGPTASSETCAYLSLYMEGEEEEEGMPSCDEKRQRQPEETSSDDNKGW